MKFEATASFLNNPIFSQCLPCILGEKKFFSANLDRAARSESMKSGKCLSACLRHRRCARWYIIIFKYYHNSFLKVSGITFNLQKSK